jgi:hypothetical protein
MMRGIKTTLLISPQPTINSHQRRGSPAIQSNSVKDEESESNEVYFNEPVGNRVS